MMIFVGDILKVIAGEIVLAPIDFGPYLRPGETVGLPISVSLANSVLSLVLDERAGNLVLGVPQVSGNGVTPFVGGLGTTGFQPGVIYSLFATAPTSLGQTLTLFGNIRCISVSPPPSSEGLPPMQVIPVTASFTATQSALYALNAPNIVVTLPPTSTWALGAGPVAVADLTGTYGGVVNGVFLNAPSTTLNINPFSSYTFVPSQSPPGWIITG